MNAPDPQRPFLVDQLRVLRPRIPATLSLVAANLLVFAAMLWNGAGLWHFDSGIQLAWGANFGPATKDGEWWRLGTALFLHFGLFHLVMNMLSLWDGGRLVERMYGPGRFVLIYFSAGLMGNLLSLIAQGDRAVSGGASGAIFGIYGALLSFLWLERKRLHPSEFKRLFWGAAVFSALAIGLGLQIKGIDNHAHVGGLVGGLLMGLVLAPPGGPAHRLTRTLAGFGFSLGVAVMLIQMPEPRYRWSEEQRARSEIIAFLSEETRISAHWGEILDRARAGGASFDQLAGLIETQVANPYENCFENLSRLHLDPAAPSASALTALRQYAELRRDASLGMVEGLRAKDPALIRESLEKARQAVERVNPDARGTARQIEGPSP